MQQSEETLKEVLLYARLHGHRPTRAQVRRYQQNGLIPKPRQIGLGRGKGTEVKYPAGTGAQLVAACKAVKSKSFRLARWSLWWDRWPIEPGRIKADLLVQTRRSQKHETLPRSIRRRLNPAQTKRFRQIASPLFAGRGEESLSPEDERLVAKGMGIDPSIVTEMGRPGYWPVAGFGNILQTISRVIAGDTIRLDLKKASDEDLRLACDEVRVVVANADALNGLLLSLGAPSSFKGVVAGLARLSPSQQQSAVVTWLSVRQLPRARTIYAAILQLCVRPYPTEKPKDNSDAGGTTSRSRN